MSKDTPYCAAGISLDSWPQLAHGLFDRDAIPKRPGFQFNLITGTPSSVLLSSLRRMSGERISHGYPNAACHAPYYEGVSELS